MVTVVVYVSGHGFGHATRCLELIDSLAAKSPGIRVVVRTSVPRWFLERAARTPIDIQTAEVDTGVVQIDSLHIDEDGTALQAARFYSTFDERVQNEAAVIASLGASVVVGDLPPLAFAAAARTGVPSVAVGNFTWDWIYGAYPQFAQLAPDVIGIINDSYGHAGLALRLPLHGGFVPMARVTRDIPFIARRSRRSKADVRAALALGNDSPIVLASFGAYGVDVPLEQIARNGAFTLVATEYECRTAPGPGDRLTRFTSSDLAERRLRYEDLVAASDVVVSKPGYGIISECVANGAALLYTSRDRFIEYDVLVEEAPGHLRCRFMPPADFAGGRWGDAIVALLNQPVPSGPAGVNGADIAADAILELV